MPRIVRAFQDILTVVCCMTYPNIGILPPMEYYDHFVGGKGIEKLRFFPIFFGKEKGFIMTDNVNLPDEIKPDGVGKKLVKAGADILAGAIPYAGGILSAIKGAYQDKEQEKANAFLANWIAMLQDEMKEKQQTILEIMSRLDLQDDKISEKVSSKEFQSLSKKAFREWGAAESDQKRVYIRNILSNTAADLSSSHSYDVIRMFLDWIKTYSELHFRVMEAIYNQPNGITRFEIWEKLGRPRVREDSADADLYRLVIRELSTGGIIRQHRDVTFDGQFLKHKSGIGKSAPSTTMESAFEQTKRYELTNLGKDFVHYAMSELPIKIEFKPMR